MLMPAQFERNIPRLKMTSFVTVLLSPGRQAFLFGGERKLPCPACHNLRCGTGHADFYRVWNNGQLSVDAAERKAERTEI